jgi:hypothetical protein
MRYVLVGFCIFAAACSDATPTGPTSVSALNGGVSALNREVVAPMAVRSISDLPFKGDLQATEAVEGNLHRLSGTGNGTHIGQFTYAAAITVDEATGQGLGTVVWTAANGDQIFASTTGEVLGLEFPNLVLAETQTITGGTGRFAGVTGTVVVNRSLDLLTGVTSGTFTGAINLGH